MIDSWDCRHHCLLVEGVRHNLSLVAKTQYCAILVSRGGWYKVTIFFLLPPLQLPAVPWTINGPSCAAVDVGALWSSCVMRPVNSCRTCSDSRNIRFSPMQQKPISFDTIHPVSVAIRYRSDTRPFSNSESLLCAWLSTGTIKTKPTVNRSFYLKTSQNRPHIWKWKLSWH